MNHQADSQESRQNKGNGANGLTKATLRAKPTFHGLSWLQLIGSGSSVKPCRQCLHWSPGLVHCQVGVKRMDNQLALKGAAGR